MEGLRGEKSVSCKKTYEDVGAERGVSGPAI